MCRRSFDTRAIMRRNVIGGYSRATPPRVPLVPFSGPPPNMPIYKQDPRVGKREPEV